MSARRNRGCCPICLSVVALVDSKDLVEGLHYLPCLRQVTDNRQNPFHRPFQTTYETGFSRATYLAKD